MQSVKRESVKKTVGYRNCNDNFRASKSQSQPYTLQIAVNRYDGHARLHPCGIADREHRDAGVDHGCVDHSTAAYNYRLVPRCCS